MLVPLDLAGSRDIEADLGASGTLIVAASERECDALELQSRGEFRELKRNVCRNKNEFIIALAREAGAAQINTISLANTASRMNLMVVASLSMVL